MIKLFLNSKLDLIQTAKFVKQLFRIQIQKGRKVLLWNHVKSKMACYSEVVLEIFSEVAFTFYRMFPSLVNCCTIDWFTEWPEDALEKVATKFLEDMDMDDEVISDFIYPTHTIITHGLYFFNPFFEGKNDFFKEVFCKILAFCMVSIQEGFLIKSRL